MVSTVVTPRVILAGVAALAMAIYSDSPQHYCLFSVLPVEPEIEPGHDDDEHGRGVDLEQIVAERALWSNPINPMM